jgi:XTP/dITP diphosphohydrolase
MKHDFNTLIFASGNAHKAEEVQAAFEGQVSIALPKDLGYAFDVAETGMTLQENAILKAEEAWQLTGKPSFADDTGLFCEALNGLPGVHTARFAAIQGYSGSNNELLLDRLSHNEQRDAFFESVFCLRWEQGRVCFQGVLPGTIALEQAGNGGFGYDPVFIPQGFSKTLAELPLRVKLLISHRSQALRSMQAWIAAFQSL